MQSPDRRTSRETVAATSVTSIASVARFVLQLLTSPLSAAFRCTAQTVDCTHLPSFICLVLGSLCLCSTVPPVPSPSPSPSDPSARVPAGAGNLLPCSVLGGSQVAHRGLDPRGCEGSACTARVAPYSRSDGGQDSRVAESDTWWSAAGDPELTAASLRRSAGACHISGKQLCR